ncbi:MAG: LCP family protein [Clostridiales bacterium]|jgi:LCP family protein required for cell wall assembly|nr:LCP family protein [Clostridiales bacterium]
MKISKIFKNKTIKRSICILIPVLIVVELAIYIVLAQLHAPVPPTSSEEVILDEQGNAVIVTGENRKQNFFTVLLVGKDAIALNTDTIMVAAIDVTNKQYSLMSIPRDTMTKSMRSVKKINAAYASGGIEQLKKEVADLIGFKVDRHVIIKLDGFEKVIDIIGGVEIDVPQDMNYDDPAQNLHIHLKTGLQVLNGKNAVGFVRYRSGYLDADLGRIKAQQSFLTSVIKKMASPANFFKIVPIVTAVFDNIETDMTLGEMVWAATNMRDIQEEQVTMATIPGQSGPYDGLSYYFVNNTQTLELINEKWNPYTIPITALNLSTAKPGEGTVAPVATPVTTTQPSAPATTTNENDTAIPSATPLNTPKISDAPEPTSPTVTPSQTFPSSGRFNSNDGNNTEEFEDE